MELRGVNGVAVRDWATFGAVGRFLYTLLFITVSYINVTSWRVRISPSRKLGEAVQQLGAAAAVGGGRCGWGGGCPCPWRTSYVRSQYGRCPPRGLRGGAELSRLPPLSNLARVATAVATAQLRGGVLELAHLV